MSFSLCLDFLATIFVLLRRKRWPIVNAVYRHCWLPEESLCMAASCMLKYPARCERAAEQRGNQFLRNAIILMASPQNLLLLHKPSAFLYICLSHFYSIFGRISTTRPKTCKMYSSFCKQKRILAYCTTFSATTLPRKLRCNSFITQIIHSFYCSFMYSLVRH